MSDAHHGLIFRHDGNARAAASVILIGVMAALIGSVFMAIGPKFKQEPRFTRDAATEPATPVRVVGTAPRENVACDHQVWPNIDQRCLVRREAAASPAETSPPPPSAPPPPATASTPAVQPPLPNDSGKPIRQSAMPAPAERNGIYVRDSADFAVSFPEDDEQFYEPPISEPPRKRVRRHHRNYFHLNFGGFRF
jgi:hypothetical protein